MDEREAMETPKSAMPKPTTETDDDPLADDKLPISPRYAGLTPGDIARKLFRPTWKVPRRVEGDEGEKSAG